MDLRGLARAARGCDLGAAHPKLVGVLEGKERRFRASEMHARFSLSVADALGN